MPYDNVNRTYPPITYFSPRVMDPESFLGRFDDVAGGGNNSQGVRQWTCKCPAHETSHRSLAVGLTGDGRWLIHCHAGCEVGDVLAAVGLDLRDLYPDGPVGRYKPLQRPQRLREEEWVVTIAEADRRHGRRLSEADKQRELAARIALKKANTWPKGE